MSDMRYFFREHGWLPIGWRCDRNMLLGNGTFFPRAIDGLTYFNIELEGIYDMPRGTVNAIMFYHDLMVFLCSGRFYVWDLSNRPLYEFTTGYASIDDLSSDAVRKWMPGTLPPTLVVGKKTGVFDNSSTKRRKRNGTGL